MPIQRVRESPHILTPLAQDPFGDLLKKLMDEIHNYLEMPELSRDFGTQKYEQQVVELSKTGKTALERRRAGLLDWPGVGLAWRTL